MDYTSPTPLKERSPDKSFVSLPMAHRPFGQTQRRGLWWVQPVAVFLGLGIFVVYSTWAAFQGNYYYVSDHHYLSPFYSPELFGSGHPWIGSKPMWWPSWLIFSPALFILWAPGGFRLTCYYYRGAYYKAFWADPPTCAVGEPRKSYWGERTFPLIIQNIHRYFMYLALIFLVFLAIDVWHALWYTDPAGHEHFSIGIGTIILTLNVCLLSGYTFGCHSLRHLIGGSKDSLSKAPMCGKAYNCVSCFNRRHMLWAWCSLFMVGFADLYVRLVSMGIWHDWRLF